MPAASSMQELDEGEARMTEYRVYFFKHLLNSDGHRFKCLQSEFEIVDCATQAEAMECALHKFAAQHGCRDWKIYADHIEITSIPDVEAVTPALKEAA
jgi:hypothetical protein